MAKKTIQVVYKVDSKELLQTQKVIDGIEKEAKQADDAVKKFGADAKKAGNDAAGGMKNASGSAMNLRNVMDSILALGITHYFAQAGKAIFDLGVKQEQLNVAFTVFLGSATKAKKLIGDLTEFSIVTPFTPDQVNQAAKSLLAFGVAGEEIIPTLKFLGDVSAGTGKDLSEMAIIFGQIRSTGRLMGQDLLQLINAGFNPLQIISQKTGKSVKALKEDMEDGLVSFDMVKQAFIDATSAGGTFFNLMDKQSATIGGKLSTIAGNIEEVAKGIFEGNIGLIGTFIDKLGLATDVLLKWVKTANSDPNFEKAQKNAESYRASLDAAFAEFTAGKGPEAINKAIAENVTATNEWEDSVQELEELVKHSTGDTFEKYNNQLVEEQQTVRLLGEITSEYIKKVQTYIPPLKEVTDEEKKRQKELIKMNEELLKLQANSAKVREEFVKYKAQFNDFDFFDKIKEGLDQVGDDAWKEVQKGLDAQTSAEWAKSDEARDAQQATFDQRKRLEQQALDFGLNAIATLALAKNTETENELTALQASTEEQIKLAGDNERAKDQIKAQSKIKEDALKKRQIEEDKRNTVKRILIEGALNAVKALGLPPIPGANFIAAAFALGQAGIQAAAVRGFKDGEVNINGKGTTTSDSIPAMLSRGESVINARATARSSNLLEAINDRKIDDRVLRNGSLGNRGPVSFNDSRIVSAIENNKVDYARHGTVLMEVKETKNKFKLYMRSKNQGY